jgi:hypothetical protein
MKTSTLAPAMLCVAFALIGCNRSSATKTKQVQADKTGNVDTKSVTLHFDGFKKTESGST